ncbi:MAG: hypothetical protein O3B24_05315 [Verrucomicrobia bacterium]|nr:hypothetical protein [Verrucomicrobiota bacterium]
MDAINTERKGDFMREVMADLRKTEQDNRQLQTENTQLTEEVKRLKRTVSAQADAIVKLKRA